MPLKKEILDVLHTLRWQDWPEGVRQWTMVEHPQNSWPMMKGWHDDIPFSEARRFEDKTFGEALRRGVGKSLMDYGSQGRFFHEPMNDRFDRARNEVKARGLLSEYLKDINY